MALIPGSPPNPPIPCWMGHYPCELHTKTKPDLSDLPGVESVRNGNCVGEGGHAAYRVWDMPDIGYLCRRHMRELLRRATWPFTIRFPDER